MANKRWATSSISVSGILQLTYYSHMTVGNTASRTCQQFISHTPVSQIVKMWKKKNRPLRMGGLEDIKEASSFHNFPLYQSTKTGPPSPYPSSFPSSPRLWPSSSSAEWGLPGSKQPHISPSPKHQEESRCLTQQGDPLGWGLCPNHLRITQPLIQVLEQNRCLANHYQTEHS